MPLQVRVLVPDAKGGRIEVAVLGRGQFVGERSVINDKLRSADCVAQGRVQVRKHMVCLHEVLMPGGLNSVVTNTQPRRLRDARMRACVLQFNQYSSLFTSCI
jgi:CRP-like cAMP-binding protein